MGHVDHNDGKDVNILNANMPFKKWMSDEDIATMEKIVELKHEVWKLDKV
jgi:hypothetical protein